MVIVVVLHCWWYDTLLLLLLLLLFITVVFTFVLLHLITGYLLPHPFCCWHCWVVDCYVVVRTHCYPLTVRLLFYLPLFVVVGRWYRCSRYGCCCWGIVVMFGALGICWRSLLLCCHCYCYYVVVLGVLFPVYHCSVVVDYGCHYDCCSVVLLVVLVIVPLYGCDVLRWCRAELHCYRPATILTVLLLFPPHRWNDAVVPGAALLQVRCALRALLRYWCCVAIIYPLLLLLHLFCPIVVPTTFVVLVLYLVLILLFVVDFTFYVHLFWNDCTLPTVVMRCGAVLFRIAVPVADYGVVRHGVTIVLTLLHSAGCMRLTLLQTLFPIAIVLCWWYRWNAACCYVCSLIVRYVVVDYVLRCCLLPFSFDCRCS